MAHNSEEVIQHYHRTQDWKYAIEESDRRITNGGTIVMPRGLELDYSGHAFLQTPGVKLIGNNSVIRGGGIAIQPSDYTVQELEIREFSTFGLAVRRAQKSRVRDLILEDGVGMGLLLCGAQHAQVAGGFFDNVNINRCGGGGVSFCASEGGLLSFGNVAPFTITNAGAGYPDGSHNVQITTTGGGSNATAVVEIVAGSVEALTIMHGGTDYAVGDVISFNLATGAGFAATVENVNRITGFSGNRNWINANTFTALEIRSCGSYAMVADGDVGYNTFVNPQIENNTTPDALIKGSFALTTIFGGHIVANNSLPAGRPLFDITGTGRSNKGFGTRLIHNNSSAATAELGIGNAWKWHDISYSVGGMIASHYSSP